MRKTPELWRQAWACLASDNGVTVNGNELDAWSVIETIKFVNDDLMGYGDFEHKPFREEIEAEIWSWGENPHEIAELEQFEPFDENGQAWIVAGCFMAFRMGRGR